MILQKQLKQMIEQTYEVPTLPVIATQVIEILDNPNSSVKDLTVVINKDQVTMAKILKLVNSAFYGFPQRITTISHAITILGFNTVKGLILSISAFDSLKAKEFSLVEFWHHSISTATAAKYIAKQTRYPKEEEAFTVSLIHDIGKLVMVINKPKEYKEIMKLISEQGLMAIDAENQILDFNHAQIGGIAAECWNLPPIYNDTIYHHHNPEESTIDHVLTKLLFLSDIASNIFMKEQEASALYPNRQLVMEKLKFSENNWQLLIQHLIQKKDEINEFLNLVTTY